MVHHACTRKFTKSLVARFTFHGQVARFFEPQKRQKLNQPAPLKPVPRIVFKINVIRMISSANSHKQQFKFVFKFTFKRRTFWMEHRWCAWSVYSGALLDSQRERLSIPGSGFRTFPLTLNCITLLLFAYTTRQRNANKSIGCNFFAARNSGRFLNANIFCQRILRRAHVNTARVVIVCHVRTALETGILSAHRKRVRFAWRFTMCN